MNAPSYTAEFYTPALREEWDAFARTVRQSSFLMERGFMDYHADRFADASLMVRRADGRLAALLPACRSHEAADAVESHGGLTYGGLLSGPGLTVAAAGAALDACLERYRAEGFGRLLYKPMPHVYHTLPAEEDLYWLFRRGATLRVRNVSAVADLRCPLRPAELRRRGARRALGAGVEVAEGDPGALDAFHALLSGVLAERHGARPVHTAAELRLLMERFPGRVRLFLARAAGEPVAGTLLFVTPRVTHVQYIAAGARGRALGALDLLFTRLLADFAADAPQRPYFDFGTSNEQGGRVLNEGLIFQKEGFGARAVCYDTWQLDF